MSKARCLFYKPSFFKMKFGLRGGRWMVEMVNVLVIREQKRSKPLTYTVYSCFRSLILEVGSYPLFKEIDLPLPDIGSEALGDQSPSTETDKQDREQPCSTASSKMSPGCSPQCVLHFVLLCNALLFSQPQ